MNQKFRIYFDVNVWQKLNLIFSENKKSNPVIWNIFKEQWKGKVEIYSSDIHLYELKNNQISGNDGDNIEEKIKQCSEKSDQIVQNKFNKVTNKIEYNGEEIKKYHQIKTILNPHYKNDDVSSYKTYHLLSCFLNDIDAFLTYDETILKNVYEIKKIFNSWDKKKFIISTPEKYAKLKNFIQAISYGSFIAIPSIILIFFFKLDYLGVFLGLGLFLNVFLLGKIHEFIQKFEYKDINMGEISKNLDFIKTFSTFYYSIFAIYSGFILILASQEIRNVFFSSIWLLSLIFAFQIPILFFGLYMIEYKKDQYKISRFFNVSYIILAGMFGWSSANIAHDILFIPLLPDLTVATFGTLILLYIFLKNLYDEIIIY